MPRKAKDGRRRGMSRAARKRLSEFQKARWAKIRGERKVMRDMQRAVQTAGRGVRGPRVNASDEDLIRELRISMRDLRPITTELLAEELILRYLALKR